MELQGPAPAALITVLQGSPQCKQGQMIIPPGWYHTPRHFSGVLKIRFGGIWECQCPKNVVIPKKKQELPICNIFTSWGFQNGFIFPNFRVENKKVVETTTQFSVSSGFKFLLIHARKERSRNSMHMSQTWPGHPSISNTEINGP